MWEGYFFKNIIMMVVCNNISSRGRYGTIDKFVVVRILLYQFETVIGRNKLNERAVNNGLDYYLGRFEVREALQYLHVLGDYLVRHAQDVASLHQRLPHLMVAASGRDALNQAVGI